MEYYIQQKSRGYVGNSMLWWRHNNCGYVCDIREAKVWTEEEAKHHVEMAAGDLVAWPKPYIDERIKHHIDMQTVERGEGGAIAYSENATL